MQDLADLLILQLENGGKADLTVTGWSMHPMLHNGRDKVTLTPPGKELKKKDIILYRRENGQYVLHRIIDLDSGKYILCGDNQAMRETVDPSQVIGVVSAFTHKGKPCSMGSFGYRLYAWAWVELFGLRRAYISIRRPAGRLLSKLNRKLRKRQREVSNGR